MPTTRSAAIASSSKRRQEQEQAEPTEPGSDLESLNIGIELELHLSKLRSGLQKLRKESASLRTENEKLRESLDKVNEAQDVSIQPKRGKRGGPSTTSLKAEVEGLQGEVRKLEKAKEKLRKKIKEMERKEAKREAADLQEELQEAADDSTYHMRKLLRRFHDLMLETVIEETETCPICLEPLQANKCSSFQCQHIVCNDCLPNIAPSSEILPCAQCRTQCPREDIETVHRTAPQQWDELMKIAVAWAKLDQRREIDTSEEEAEEDAKEQFINDDESRESSPKDSEREHTTENNPQSERTTESTPEPIATGPVTPPPSSRTHQLENSPPSYNQSPAAEKRKRLEQLAEERQRKKNRSAW